MIRQKEIVLPPFPRGFHLITSHVESAWEEWPRLGLLHLFIKHTSAAISINENADPSVRIDMEEIYNRLVPENQPFYTHVLEGPDDMPSHVKAGITGFSLSIPVSNGHLNLGTWQGIYLCEFRNHGGRRKLVLTVIGA